MSDNLKNRTITGMLWSSIQRFGRMSIMFIGNVVLARMLTPEDFGCIGMLMVFIAVANTFVDSGFCAALIQKKDPTPEDYSTVFYWNLFIAVLCFSILYICSPRIAVFYRIPELCLILRIQGSILIINAFSIIQSNLLIKKLHFKKLAYLNLSSSFLGVVGGIIAAYYGMGVWSLVVLNLSTSIYLSFFLWFSTKWYPLWCFSVNSFRQLFTYGGLILLASLVETVYNNLQTLIIGRIFSAKILGYFTQAKKMEEVPVSSLSQVVNEVTFPVYSQIQDDRERLRRGIQKSIKAITYLNFPLMVVLAITAPGLIRLLFTEKWNDSIPFFQILCLADMWFTMNTTNVSAIKALGRSDVNLYTQFIKKGIGLSFIVIGLSFGIWGLMFALVVDMFTHFLINAFTLGRLLGYGIMAQLRDIFPQYLLTVVLGLGVYYGTSFLHIHYITLMVLQGSIFILGYIGISYWFGLDGFGIYYKIISEKLK